MKVQDTLREMADEIDAECAKIAELIDAAKDVLRQLDEWAFVGDEDGQIFEALERLKRTVSALGVADGD